MVCLFNTILQQTSPFTELPLECFSQDMKDSPAIYQWYVTRIPSPIRKRYPETLVYDYVVITSNTVIATIQDAGFTITEAKIQQPSPWKYLGFQIREQTIQPQLRDKPKTLHNVQKLLGTINCIRPLLGIAD